MTATTEFERSVTIACEPAAVYAELSDPSRQIGLQPLLIAVSEIDAGDDPRRTRRFEAVEVVRMLGFLKWKNRIRVCVDLVQPDEIVDFEARSVPRIVVRSRFTLSPVDSGTRVHEAVRLDAPAWLRRGVVPQAVRAQEALLANLKRRLETGPDPQ